MKQKYRGSATLSTDQKDTQILAEAFKVQGNYCLLLVFSHNVTFYQNNCTLQLNIKAPSTPMKIFFICCNGRECINEGAAV
jgi:hypothetical protein